MEAKSALVWSDCAVELNPVALIDLHVAFVVEPRDAELNDTFRDHDLLKNTVLLVFGFALDQCAERCEHFRCSLQEFLFPWLVVFETIKDAAHIRIHTFSYQLTFKMGKIVPYRQALIYRKQAQILIFSVEKDKKELNKAKK